MWPWEHVAVGYLLVSLYRHARYRDAPREAVAFAAVFGAALPDLVDKPLSWGLGLFPEGYSVAHSVFVAAAVLALAYGLAYRTGHLSVGTATAFAIGWGSHLVGDVLFPAVQGGRLAFARVLWPVVTLPPYEQRLGFFTRTMLYLHRHAEVTLARGLGPELLLEVGMMLFVVVLWLYDGSPGLGLFRPGRSGSD